MALKPTKLQVLQALGTFWTEVFQDTDMVDADAEARSQYLQPFADFSASSADYISVDKIPSFRNEDITLYLLSDTLYYDEQNVERRTSLTVPITYNSGPEYNDGYWYNQLINDTVYKYAIGDRYIPRYLGTAKDGTGTLLINGVDYTVEDGYLVLDVPLEQLIDPTLTSVDGDGNTVYSYNIWGFANLVDEQAVQNIYGYLVRLYGQSGSAYHDAVRLAWDLQLIGATTKNLDRSLCFLTNVDHYDGPGDELVTDIFIEADRRWVSTASGIWSAPIESGVLVRRGELLTESQQLFDRYAIYDSNSQPDAEAIPGVSLEIGFMGSAYTGPIYLENADKDITLQHTADWYYVDYGSGTYQIRDVNGAIVTVINTEAEAQAYLRSVPSDIYTFDISTDTQADWYTLMVWLNEDGFFEELAAANGRVPLTTNPLRTLREYLFGNKLTILSITTVAEREQYISQLLSVLGSTWPAGMSFIFHVVSEVYDDTYTSESIKEMFELFTAHEYDDAFDTMKDFQLASVVHNKVEPARSPENAPLPKTPPIPMYEDVIPEFEPPPIRELVYQYSPAEWDDPALNEQYSPAVWDDSP